jgi:geranylgeranyl pyrophosphate synthase
MDDDDIRRGKLTTHKKFGESTAVLAGNSLLTLAFEILSDPKFNINNNKKISLINLISQSSGHQGIAGGQFLDLNYERKKVSKQKVIDMEIKKTGKLFSFSCLSPVILTNKKDQIKKFSIIGEKIGLLFQIADDLIDYSSTSKTAGKKTNKDSKRGKATLISLLGYKNAIKYASKLKKEIFNSLVSYGNNASDLKETIEFILSRNK